MKSVKTSKNIGALLVLIGTLFVFLGSFLKIGEISNIYNNMLMATGLVIEIIGVYFLFKHSKSLKKKVDSII